MVIEKIIAKTIEISHALYDPTIDMRCQHFSFLIYKGRILLIGKNSKKTHPLNLRNPKYSADHINVSYQKGSCAELNVLLKLKNFTNIRADKCTMINIRIDNNYRLAYSKPCSSCTSLLRFFGISDVYYSTNEQTFDKI